VAAGPQGQGLGREQVEARPFPELAVPGAFELVLGRRELDRQLALAAMQGYVAASRLEARRGGSHVQQIGVPGHEAGWKHDLERGAALLEHEASSAAQIREVEEGLRRDRPDLDAPFGQVVPGPQQRGEEVRPLANGVGLHGRAHVAVRELGTDASA
jgi:hypothetical protein